MIPLRPRVVTFYYRWNDHWIAYGIEDKNVARLKDLSSPFLESLRIGRLLMKIRIGRAIGSTQWPNRVSEEEFRDNLTATARSARAAGIVPVLLTATSWYTDAKALPRVTERILRRPEDLVPLHRRYAEIVREVAQDEPPHRERNGDDADHDRPRA